MDRSNSTPFRPGLHVFLWVIAVPLLLLFYVLSLGPAERLLRWEHTRFCYAPVYWANEHITFCRRPIQRYMTLWKTDWVQGAGSPGTGHYSAIASIGGGSRIDASVRSSLARANIPCTIVGSVYHSIAVDPADAADAVRILQEDAKQSKYQISFSQ
jgi:hypothetical protein